MHYLESRRIKYTSAYKSIKLENVAMYFFWQCDQERDHCEPTGAVTQLFWSVFRTPVPSLSGIQYIAYIMAYKHDMKKKK